MTSCSLPARFLHARQLTEVSLLSKADTTDAKEANVSACSSTNGASVVRPHLELRLPLLFFNKRCFCHSFSRRYQIGPASPWQGRRA